MKALVFQNNMLRTVATALVAKVWPRAYVSGIAPMALREVPEPRPRPGWVNIRTSLCGLCGSDYKQVFLNGSYDNPMTAMISFPQVLGHEVVGYVGALGDDVPASWTGCRVVLNPWLSCVTRGIAPICSWCERGDLAQCENFTGGNIAPGIHHGNSRDAPGGFADTVPAHLSQCLPIPDDVSFEQAVLADPFSVSLHATLHSPPRPDGTVIVYGCGTLGLLNIAILRLLFPNVRVFAVARYPHQEKLARQFGAAEVFPWRPVEQIIERTAQLVGTKLLKPWYGKAMLNGGVDAVYDSVGSPESIEVGVRVTRSRGKIVVTGVEKPKRFEWTPLYFKEVSLVGSNAFGIEEWDGRRQHAMQWYFELIRTRRLDVTPILTHRFALDDYRDAFMACFDQGKSGAVKVLFEYPVAAHS